MLRRAATTMVAAALLAGCGSERDPEPYPVLIQDDAVFLHRSDAEVAGSLDDVRDLGFNWLRITAGWSVIAPEPRARRTPRFDQADPDAYPRGAWDRLDRAVRGAHDRGLRVMIDIAFWAPRWAVARTGDAPDRQRDTIDPAAYGRFAEAVARRYRSAEGFTVWNEPNFGIFFLPQYDDGKALSPHLYRAMVAAAVPAIRRHAPGATVLIGATAGVGEPVPTGRDSRMPPLRFLRALACVDEALEPLRTAACADFTPLPGDGWSHHPYSISGPPYTPDAAADDVRIGDLGRLTGLLRRLSATGRTERRLPVWITEYGYQTSPPDPTQPNTLAEQARWLPQAYRIARQTPDVASFAQFLLRDLPARDGSTERERWSDFQSGLRLPDGTPKPAQRALAEALRAGR